MEVGPVTRRRVLLVEDDDAIREVIRLHLDLAGLDVAEAADGKRALDLARKTLFDLLILDVMLPGIDGVTLCRATRLDGANTLTPILMLTAKDTEADKVLGLESGADDYLTKPFGTRELIARVMALLRRQERLTRTATEATRHIAHNGIMLDLDKRPIPAHYHRKHSRGRNQLCKNVRTHAAGFAAPHFGQQRVTVEDDAAMCDEQMEEIEFLLGQLDRLATHRRLARAICRHPNR